jgi:segregation and condensation protein A
MKENQKTLNTNTDPKFKVYVKGEIFTKIPEDFYLPPDALKIVLESFEGPLDLLLYLIRRENIDILELSVSKITDQYMEYINLMKTLQLELAAEYLLMAATLTAIKARMLIPSNEDKEDEEDPRDELIRRLREYERFKKVSLELDDYSRIYRDFYPISELSYKKVVKDEKVAPLDLDNLVTVFNDLLIRHDALNSHDVKKDTISVREKMTFILDGLKNDEFIDFKNFIDSSEGRAGIIVIFLAILELIKMNLIECLQSKSMSVIYIKSKQQLENKEEVIYEQ